MDSLVLPVSVGMPSWTLSPRISPGQADAERRRLHSHGDRGNEWNWFPRTKPIAIRSGFPERSQFSCKSSGANEFNVFSRRVAGAGAERMPRYRGPRRRGIRCASAPATLPDHFPRERRRLTKRSQCGSGESRSSLLVKTDFPERSQFGCKSSGANEFTRFPVSVGMPSLDALRPHFPGQADAERQDCIPTETVGTSAKVVSPNEANRDPKRFPRTKPIAIRSGFPERSQFSRKSFPRTKPACQNRGAAQEIRAAGLWKTGRSICRTGSLINHDSVIALS